jgi:hypothetical protein
MSEVTEMREGRRQGVREVRRGEIEQWRIRDSTVFLWVDNFTCGHARICAERHHFIYHLAEHKHHTQSELVFQTAQPLCRNNSDLLASFGQTTHPPDSDL